MEVSMQAYSKEMRRDVLSACDAGEGTRAVALRFGCSESWVRRVKQERREQGKVAPATTRRRIPRWAAYREQMERIVAEKPDITLQELKDELGAPLSRQTLCTALRKLKLTLKKSTEGRRAGSAGRRRATSVVASATSGTRSGTSGFHR
jgi:transposase